ncbi:MAG: DUF1266 domain-containing protein [Flavobacteriales bacterium]|nr:DUF1266 domain-containing protein [Flavobacteriales bacterium]
MYEILQFWPYIAGGILLISFGIKFVQWLAKAKDITKSILKGAIHINEKTKLPLEHQWALAVGANLSARNTMYLNSLETGMSKLTIKQLLPEWWGIETRDDAIGTLNWILKHGHQDQYDAIKPIIWNHPEDEWLDRVKALNDPDLTEKMENLMEGTLKWLEDEESDYEGDMLPDVLAWDMGRLISVARWCFEIELITEEEAWDYIFAGAKIIQRNYKSWHAVSTNYLYGRLFWGGYSMDFDVMKADHKTLMEHERSPFNTLDWNIPLP